MTSAVLVGASAAALVCSTAVLTYLFTRHARRGVAPQEAVDVFVSKVAERVDRIAQDLEARFDAGSWRTIDDPSMVTDLDEVLQWTLRAAGSIDGADAVLVACDEVDGLSLTVSSGLDLEEAQRYKLSGPPDGRVPQAIELAYRYGPEESRKAVRRAVAVPLVSEHRQLGWIAVFSFDDMESTQDLARRLETLAARAAGAIEIARRFRELRRLAETDPLTRLHNRRYFHESLAREVARAQRYDRRLSLIFFDLDNFKAINDRIGHLAGDAVLAEAAARVLAGVRSADITCRIGGDEFAVILTETGAEEAERLKRRIESAVSARPITSAVRLSLSGGVAELKAEDDAASFFTRANAAAQIAKAARERPPALLASKPAGAA